MLTTNGYRIDKNAWWCLPLVLPSVLLPLATAFSTFTLLGDGRTVLYYLPHALFMALMLIFDWAALPGIILALMIRYLPDYGPLYTLNVGLVMLVPLTVCWTGYRAFVWRRHRILLGHFKLILPRFLWLVVVYSILVLTGYQFAVFLGLLDGYLSLNGAEPLAIRTLINFQSLLVGCLSGTPLCYLTVRAIRNPYFCRAYWSRLKKQLHPEISCAEVVCWFVVTAGLVFLMLSLPANNGTIFNTNYTFTLLLPLMLWGTVRFGYLLITTFWGILLIVLCRYYSHYVPAGADFALQLAITSSCWTVFSFTITLMASVTTRQRAIWSRMRRLVLIDPVVQLPNLRALSRDLGEHAGSVLCFLRIPELEILGRNYGVMIRIQYKQQLTTWLGTQLCSDESVYNLSGHDMVIRLNTREYELHVVSLYQAIKDFRLTWDGMSFQPSTGVSYCVVHPPVTHLPLLLGELSTVADLSLVSLQPESLQQAENQPVQKDVRDSMSMMNALQDALDNDRFLLMARPVLGTRGDYYYDIQAVMVDEQGGVTLPQAFALVAQARGLSSRIDSWVIARCARFIAQYRTQLPGCRMSIPLSPASVCRRSLCAEVAALIAQYALEPWQLMFDVTGRAPLANMEQAEQNLSLLQEMGCRVAIGTGYGSFNRLQHTRADVLRIDSSFTPYLLAGNTDYQLIESVCHFARARRMQIVASQIDNDVLFNAAAKLGIDYVEGRFIGEPVQLNELLQPGYQEVLKAKGNRHSAP